MSFQPVARNTGSVWNHAAMKRLGEGSGALMRMGMCRGVR